MNSQQKGPNQNICDKRSHKRRHQLGQNLEHNKKADHRSNN